MEPNVTLLRVRGIPIGVHWTWVIIFTFLTWSLGGYYFPVTVEGLEPSTSYTMALITAVLFLVSLVLHELGHALRAVKEGMEIEGITLFIFGGVARFKGMFPSAGAEFRIAIAGPLVTAVLLGLFFGASWVLGVMGAPAEVSAVVEYLAFINGLLLAFNMVPALPLDGGRVLQSYLWRREGNFSTATVQAARSGRAFGTSLIVVGLILLVTNANLGGLWFAFIGWFLRQAAQSEASFAEFRSALRGLRVRDLMTPDPESVSPEHRLTRFIDDVAHPRGHSTYPVMSGGELVGLVSLRMAGSMAPEQREATSVREVMLSGDDVPVVEQDADVLDALPALQSGPGRAVVMRNGRVVGILSGSDITRALEVGQVRQPSPEVQESTKRRARRVVWAVIAITVLGAGGLLYSPPVVVVEPGVALDVTGDISIEGVETHEVSGEYLLTSVALSQRNGFGTLLAFAQGRDVLTIARIIPRGVDPEEYFDQQRELFRQRQLVAAAAAARATGMPVELSGTGARVIGVVAGSPAADDLQEGDVITHVEGQEISLATDVGRVIQARPAGTTFVLRVERDGRRLEVDVRTREGLADDAPGIGVLIETRDMDVDLPFSVSFEQREIGGPSAGLTYALATYDLLTEHDVARERVIASTGTIDLDGRVGAVGGLAEKAETARQEGATLFLVPAEEVRGARGNGVEVRGVSTLAEALEVLGVPAPVTSG